ncbi:hypothetical protein [Youxingia wuxianensis]|uniref:Uncharacterized protein n=1 Tax=Youxingia wuxianensis TaxID=2763678 RepID=A0A926EQH4_9FIRM|nr:hypothetical protein [Youxingia wuxianensis]MBC8586298.1 hypothetical protein [Youxingia wuxianensis]
MKETKAFGRRGKQILGKSRKMEIYCGNNALKLKKKQDKIVSGYRKAEKRKISLKFA